MFFGESQFSKTSLHFCNGKKRLTPGLVLCFELQRRMLSGHRSLPQAPDLVSAWIVFWPYGSDNLIFKLVLFVLCWFFELPVS